LPRRGPKRTKPAGGGGFAYLQGPDGAIVEYAGNRPAERFNRAHVAGRPVLRAALVSKTLNARVPPERVSATPRTEANWGPDRTWPALEPEGTFRTPTSGVEFGDVSMNWYMRQGDKPLAGTRGQLTTTSRSASPISTPGSPSCAARA
jgi:hypothetical protein